MTGAAIGSALAGILWKGLRRIVQHLGRWVVGEVVRRGALALATYLEMRVVVFRRRLARILKRRHAEWRPRFIRGRIRRWLAAADWLRRQASRLAKITMDAAEPHLRDLPEQSPWESPTAWRRMVAR